ncbi:unnamed protein product [Spirodela intermedia]|uniref:Uncharacterized protein n=1 Tax=Spirodela intermedia TaxID=51605 RepID=A0A7I8KQW3_SPIIN|nr:unnamed protein product [Spirodela intermedia]
MTEAGGDLRRVFLKEMVHLCLVLAWEAVNRPASSRRCCSTPHLEHSL